MYLWIRSQDKMTLKKINDISISQNLLTNVYTIFCDHNVFGDYATKERALEVLDEINTIKWYKYMATISLSSFIDGVLSKYTDEEQLRIFKQMNTYEMPKE